MVEDMGYLWEIFIEVKPVTRDQIQDVAHELGMQ
jgi:hypothetical protein